MKYAVFDIETSARPDAAEFAPAFRAPGNYKDPEKIAASIAEQLADFVSRAALSAAAGQVVAIGIREGTKTSVIDCDGDQERAGIADWWQYVVQCNRNRVQLIGFNIANFDVPFLVRRSWALGVAIPHGMFDSRGYLNNVVFTDVAQTWQCGDRSERISLDRLSRLLGVGGKNGEGAAFAGLWRSDRQKALEYLNNDLAITEAVARRLLGIASENVE